MDTPFNFKPATSNVNEVVTNPIQDSVEKVGIAPSNKEESKKDKETLAAIKSRTMLRFFKYENGEFSINREEIFILPSARAMLMSDKGGWIYGDNDGRKKLFTEKRLGLVWWIVDINSPGAQQGLEGKELLKDGLKSLDFPDNYNPSKDKYFMAFLDDYTDMYEKAAYAKLLKQMLISFNDSAYMIKRIRDNNIKILKNNKDLDAEDIKALTASQKELINTAGALPSQIDKMRELQQLVRKEEKEVKLARGNVAITKSMTPGQ